jgi:hypothetical protein
VPTEALILPTIEKINADRANQLDKIYELDWFWLEPGDEGVDDSLNLAEKFKRRTAMPLLYLVDELMYSYILATQVVGVE